MPEEPKNDVEPTEQHMTEDQPMYEELLTAEEEAELLGIAPEEQVSQPLLSSRQVHPPGADGVFANMSAKPEGKIYEEMEPPSYAEAVEERAPSYFDTSITGISEDGEILVEGLPVGNYVALFVNIFISFSFDILGFFLTMLLATSHAAKCGSHMGLGLTMIRFGTLIKTKTDEGEMPPPEYDPDFPVDPEEEKQRQEWSAVLLMIFGTFIVLRAGFEYFRIRRMKAVIEASSSIVTRM